MSDDCSEALVHGMIFRTEPNMLRYSVKLRGLAPEKEYVIDGEEKVHTGRALMEGGILLPKSWGDFFPVEIHLKEYFAVK